MYQVHCTFWDSIKFLGSPNVQWYFMYLIYMYQVHCTFWDSKTFLGPQNVQWYLMYLHVSSTLHFLGFQKVFGIPKCAMVLDVSTCIKYIELFGIPESFWDPKMCNGTWCIHDMVQQIAWWWLLRVETCRYMHNLTIINRCVWMKLYIQSNSINQSTNSTVQSTSWEASGFSVSQ